jgi:hypothetical protein
VAVPTLLAELVDTSERVGEHTGRRIKIAALAHLLRRLSPDEIEIGVSYLAGVTRQGRSGIGYALLRDARPATNVDHPQLTLREVDATLTRIAEVSGSGSVNERARLLSELFARATPDEQDFLERLLIGELRQGALEGIMIEAVAAAAELPPEAVRRAAKVGGGVAAIAANALTHGATGLGTYAISLFQPVAPMLAQPSDDIADALSRIPMAALEWKLDGARVQVHKLGDDVRIYTRTGNDVTAAAPEIVATVRETTAHTLILDGEAIALKQNGAPYPFQDTMRRFGRELDVDAMRATMPLSVFFFDCLRRDDENVSTLPGDARFDALAAALPSPLLMPSTRHERSRRRAGVLRRGARARARRRDGEGAAGDVRAWRKKRAMAQSEAYAHARPRGARRGMGPRPRQGLSNLHSAHAIRRTGGSSCSARRSRAHRRDARVADGRCSKRAGRRATSGRPRAPGARRRDRIQRPAGESALSGRARASLRAASRDIAPTRARATPTPSTRCVRSTRSRTSRRYSRDTVAEARQRMITVYHLTSSRSERIVWLLEELGIDYQLERFDARKLALRRRR